MSCLELDTVGILEVLLNGLILRLALLIDHRDKVFIGWEANVINVDASLSAVVGDDMLVEISPQQNLNDLIKLLVVLSSVVFLLLHDGMQWIVKVDYALQTRLSLEELVDRVHTEVESGLAVEDRSAVA